MTNVIKKLGKIYLEQSGRLLSDRDLQRAKDDYSEGGKDWDVKYELNDEGNPTVKRSLYSWRTTSDVSHPSTKHTGSYLDKVVTDVYDEEQKLKERNIVHLSGVNTPTSRKRIKFNPPGRIFGKTEYLPTLGN